MRRFLLATAFLLLTDSTARAVDAVGYVKTSSGRAVALREGMERALAPGQPLFERDTIRTGPESSVGITMKDGTMLSAGPDTELVLDHYAYAPADGDLGFGARVSQGTLDFVSGMLGKLAPESVSVETPTGVIGMRGTHFVVNVAPGQKFPPKQAAAKAIAKTTATTAGQGTGK